MPSHIPRGMHHHMAEAGMHPTQYKWLSCVPIFYKNLRSLGQMKHFTLNYDIMETVGYYIDCVKPGLQNTTFDRSKPKCQAERYFLGTCNQAVFIENNFKNYR